VVRERSRLTAVFLIETEAPETAAPLGSLTVPSMTPVLAWDWANAIDGARAIRPARKKRRGAERRATGGLLW
jgi:hypothetical protein